jgi:hypothetical protein
MDFVNAINAWRLSVGDGTALAGSAWPTAPAAGGTSYRPAIVAESRDTKSAMSRELGKIFGRRGFWVVIEGPVDKISADVRIHHIPTLPRNVCYN